MVGFSCYEGYGLTETSPLVAANGWAGPGTSKLRCVGRVANGVKVTIDTMHGTTLSDLTKAKLLFTVQT